MGCSSYGLEGCTYEGNWKVDGNINPSVTRGSRLQEFYQFRAREISHIDLPLEDL